MTTSTDLKTFKIAKGTKAQIITAYNNGDIGDTDFAIATDEDYADTTLSNVATGSFENVVAQAQASGKATIIGWGMPDFSRAYTVSTSPSNRGTATEDCIFIVYCTTTNNNAAIIVGGYAVQNVFASVNGCAAAWALIGKGTEYYAANYQLVNPLSNAVQVIVPLKGA